MAEPKNKVEYERKQRVSKAALGAALACALVLAVGVGAHALNLAHLSQTMLSQQTAQNVALDDDSDKIVSKQVEVPPLVSFIGEKSEDVIESLGAGAQIVSSRSVKDADSAVRTAMDVALTSGAANSYAGTPTVHLSLDEEGLVIQAGYTANLRYLGYGTLSFTDAAENFHVLENVFMDAGLPVPEGSVKVPEKKADYAVYGADGVTLTAEDYVFKGAPVAGYEWEGELIYDYTQANAEGNLAYTVRLVTVTVIAKR